MDYLSDGAVAQVTGEVLSAKYSSDGTLSLRVNDNSRTECRDMTLKMPLRFALDLLLVGEKVTAREEWHVEKGKGTCRYDLSVHSGPLSGIPMSREIYWDE